MAVVVDMTLVLERLFWIMHLRSESKVSDGALREAFREYGEEAKGGIHERVLSN